VKQPPAAIQNTLAAGLLTYASTESAIPSHPFEKRQWFQTGQSLSDYSGGAVLDSHQLPNYFSEWELSKA
jgi:hypothetical protein